MIKVVSGLLLFSLCALAQVSPQPFNCVAAAAGTPTVRATGVSELVGETLLICAWGTYGANEQNYDIDVSLPVPLTSANPSGQKSDALLYFDEPSRSSQAANVNVFEGELRPPAAGATAAHTVRFRNIRMSEPGMVTTHILRVTNLRANVAAMPYDGMSAQALFMTVDSTPRLPGLPARVIVGMRAGNGLTSTAEASQQAGYQMQVRVQEETPAGFRKKVKAGAETDPIGLPYTTESGYLSTLFQSTGGGVSGLANGGTRIVLQFSGVSPGQQVFVSTRPIATSGAQLDLRLATPGDVGGAAVFSEVAASSPTPSPGIAPVTITNGQGMAVYEVLASDIAAIEWAQIGVVLQGGAGTPTVQAMYGPLTTSPQAWIPRFVPPRTAPVVKATGAFRDTLNRIRLTEFGSQTILNAGGRFAGKPAAAQDVDGNTWIVGRDQSNGLWVTRFDGTTRAFDQWTYVEGLAKGDPSVAVASNGVVFYAIRDNWDSCWLGRFERGVGHSWRNLGGIFATDPQLVAVDGGDVWVLGKDRWDGVWTMAVAESGTTEVPWTFRGGLVQGQLSVSHQGALAMAVGRDHTNALWFLPFTRGQSYPWAPAEGILGRDPTIGRTTAVVADNDSILLRAMDTSAGFSVQPWVSTGGVVKSESAAWLDNSLYIAGRDASNRIWWYQSASGQWTTTGSGGEAASDISAAPR